MSRFIRSVEESNSVCDDLQSITNVKEIDVQTFHQSDLDQFKNLSLSFYNEYPLHFSQTSTNFTNKSNCSNNDPTTKFNSYEKTKQIIGKMFTNCMKNVGPETRIVSNKEKKSVVKPKTPMNFKTFYLNNRFAGGGNTVKTQKSSEKDKNLSLRTSKLVNNSNISLLGSKNKPDFKKKCVNNVQISLKQNHSQEKKVLNSSFTARSLSRNSKKNELNGSFATNHLKKIQPAVVKKKIDLEIKNQEKKRENSVNKSKILKKSPKNDDKMIRSFRK